MRHVRQLEARPSGLRTVPKSRKKPRLMTILLAGLAILVVLNVVAVLKPWSGGDDQARPVRAAQPAAAPTADPDEGLVDLSTTHTRLGLFTGTEPQSVLAFRKWLGRPIKDVVDFGPRESWEQISNPTYVTDAWKGTQYRLIYAVAMLPSSYKGRQLEGMTRGAKGEFNQYFQELAEGLVAAGHANAVLRIGWEFNLESWAWGLPEKDAPVFVQFWRQVVKTMRGVPGAKFNMNWNVNNGYNRNDGVKYWPGARWVDSVGVDAYDIDVNRYQKTKYHNAKLCNAACRLNFQQTAWNEAIFGGERGLGYWTRFAALQKKEMSLPEWAMWDRNDDTGGVDNAYYIQQMHSFITFPGNRVAFAAYFDDTNSDGTHVLGPNLPQGTRAFKRLFGAPTKAASG
jgi:hypothetical protein